MKLRNRDTCGSIRSGGRRKRAGTRASATRVPEASCRWHAPTTSSTLQRSEGPVSASCLFEPKSVRIACLRRSSSQRSVQNRGHDPDIFQVTDDPPPPLHVVPRPLFLPLEFTPSESPSRYRGDVTTLAI